MGVVRRNVCAIVIATALSAEWAVAQSAIVIAGVVVDQSGGAIAGAQVSLNDAAAPGHRVTTDAGGAFRIEGVPSGRHELQIAQALFEPARIPVVIRDTSPDALRTTLRVSPLQEGVTVTGARSTDNLALDTPSPTGSRLGLTPRETPASVTIVDRTLIEQRGALDTQEILKSVPGLTAAAPPGGAGAVTYRGFGSTNVTQLFNGIAVQYDAIAARPVDSWVYERVEVIGGPSTFLFGAGAVGGSINYVTKLADRNRNSAQAQIRYGSFDTVEGNVGFNRRFGRGAVKNTLRADLGQSNSNGYVDRNERAALTSAVSLLTDFGSKVSHTLAVEYQNEQSDRPYWGTPLLNPTTGNGRIRPDTRFTNHKNRSLVAVGFLAGLRPPGASARYRSLASPET